MSTSSWGRSWNLCSNNFNMGAT